MEKQASKHPVSRIYAHREFIERMNTVTRARKAAEFREIPGYGGMTARRDGTIRAANGQELKQYDSNGYRVVATGSAKNGTKQAKVHRLVAMTYLEPDPKRKHVNHINGNRADNNLENLEWCTPHENTLHALKNGLIGQIDRNTPFDTSGEEPFNKPIRLIRNEGLKAHWASVNKNG